MLQLPTFQCPSCAGPLEQKNPASKMICCPYCGQTSYILPDGLKMEGDKNLLADYGSVFELNTEVAVNNKRYMVTGHIRNNYGDGFWDEWLLTDSNDFTNQFWMHEDEGEFILYSSQTETIEGLSFDQINVTSTINLKEFNVFIVEKNIYTINGYVGEIPYTAFKGNKVPYLDGIAVGLGKPVSIVFFPNEIHINFGEVIEINQIQRV